jgi:hypothetical protein
LAIGSDRSSAALTETSRIVQDWGRVGGGLHVLTWPETSNDLADLADWARRFAELDADLWVMTGAATSWAQLTRHLLETTAWSPARTILVGELADPRALDLVGASFLEGITCLRADGSTWSVSNGSLAGTSAGTRLAPGPVAA